ncbi:hypothetical protein VTJ04DRAFT_5928 [Mycothermus thermophilus]|uniref:uncharacterized protein n=1 Tax=Humicola insolens TaxID=85995 RepID=UPI00374279C6
MYCKHRNPPRRAIHQVISHKLHTNAIKMPSQIQYPSNPNNKKQILLPRISINHPKHANTSSSSQSTQPMPNPFYT